MQYVDVDIILWFEVGELVLHSPPKNKRTFKKRTQIRVTSLTNSLKNTFDCSFY